MVIKEGVYMERDMDLMRTILLKAEEYEHGFAPPIEIENHTPEEIGYHIHLLGEAGLAKVRDVGTFRQESPNAQIVSLTWAGHEFLDASRNNTIWNNAKEKISKLITGASIQVWMMVLTEVAKKQLGL